MAIVSDSQMNGVPRIEGSEVSVIEVYDATEQGVDPNQIAEWSPNITIADVYEALAYYHRNPQEMIEARRQLDEMMR
ncbi:DUF433 domain protein [Natrialba magadii ATCC 43099]|uniref:DUF433 domain protein n=1 Tax=Natrialba magadii (strain ATCC 43099 / DSM 3394 / CCM 3739 / CIP 104546 / IAM 13178 / JCM 8861 / NBRC 102185 / NCIMB 2190 / MS3) TaxID=547559 RepID=D3SX31_NATMM|nr:DUF433 domain-containing protein [Natrialba magadii]ADD03851.1 DUF433 domain protein [Natrialba magadii ATCC 43099]ELY33510.1 hypothetical protein C500_01720 [Natrialba magadii ATCC 43099]